LAPVAQPELPLVVLLEDRDLVALSKPAGMPTHPLRQGERGTLANALVARFPECARAGAQLREGGFVHRLDAGTSGVVVAARNHAAWVELRAAFREGRVSKRYLAITGGRPRTQAGAINAPLASRGRRAVVDAGGRSARTEWRLVEQLPTGWSLLE